MLSVPHPDLTRVGLDRGCLVDTIKTREDFSSWTETVHLLRSPKNARRLLDSIAEAEAGKAQHRELIDPDAERA
jgi:hypothetical protein